MHIIIIPFIYFLFHDADDNDEIRRMKLFQFIVRIGTIWLYGSQVVSGRARERASANRKLPTADILMPLALYMHIARVLVPILLHTLSLHTHFPNDQNKNLLLVNRAYIVQHVRARFTHLYSRRHSILF